MRKLLMGAVVALSVALLAPAAAFADDPVFPGDPYESVNEVRDVATGQPCGELVLDGVDVSGGCGLGEVSFTWKVGSESNTCEAYADALSIGTDGRMALEVAHIPPTCGGQVSVHPCRDGAGDEVPWVGSLYVDPAQPGKLFGYLPVCIAADGGPTFFDYFSVEVDSHGNSWTHAASVSGEFFTYNWAISGSVEIDY